MRCKLFWYVVRRTYPWVPLVIASWQMMTATDGDCTRAQIRFWMLYSRIDFANWLAIAIDLVQPEFWV